MFLTKKAQVRMPSEDFTRAVTVKRNTKKKSGYTVAESDGEYYVGAVPDKARVKVGDKVVGINGIKADEFADEEDANELMDSIRLVVVPAAEIDDYEAAEAEEDADAPRGASAITPVNGSKVNRDTPKLWVTSLVSALD